MNGEYVISKTPGAGDAKYNTQWKDCAWPPARALPSPPERALPSREPHSDCSGGRGCRAVKNEAGGVEYFETYVGPITSYYSQVWWTGLPAVDLPADLVKRFDGECGC